MGDDFHVGQFVEHAREHDACHACAGFVGPAEQPPDFVFGFFFARIIGKLRRARRVQPDRQIIFFDAALEDGVKLRLVERPAVDVGKHLYAPCAELADRVIHLVERRGNVVHRQRGDERRKQVGPFAHDFRHAVVGDARQRRRFIRPREKLNRRQRQREDLLVVIKLAHHAYARVEIPQHGNVQPALYRRRKRRIGFGNRLHALEKSLRENVWKNIQLAAIVHM